MELPGTTFQIEGFLERNHLQKILREQVDVISPDTMVIAEEFSYWADSNLRIDLLCLDTDANLVVIELKRDESGGHMELQAIRYAAMVSAMTFEKVADAHEKYLKKIGATDVDARQLILDFLDWTEVDSDTPFKNVHIVLASADFSKELTSSVLWLNDLGLDIRCVQIRPYKLDNQLLVDVRKVIPRPDSEDYQVKFREKQLAVKKATRDYTKFDLTIGSRKLSKLPKRALIFEVVREAVARGGKANPTAIENAIENATGGSRKLWAYVDGEYKSDQFVPAVTEAWENEGRNFHDGKWYTSDEELVVLNGKTFAFTNQWGKETRLAVDAVIELMGASDIQYDPS